jgi:branched-chain amino acid aminotransferase
VITPIGKVKSKDGAYDIHGNEPGPVASRLRKALLDIQHGLAPDPYGWMRAVV